MSELRAWVQASRPLAQGNIALPLWLGQALAYQHGYEVAWLTFAALLLWGILDQLLIVFVNDLADEETDADNHTYGFASGGSRVLVEGKLTRRALARAAWSAGIALGLYSSLLSWALSRPYLWLAWPAAVLLIGAYSLRPVRASYRRGGELLPAIGMGIVLPTLGYYAQANTLEGLGGVALVSAALFGLAGNITTALPDRPSDARAEKRTVAVVLGGRRAQVLSLVVLIAGITSATLAYDADSIASIIVITLPAAALVLVNLIVVFDPKGEDPKACRRFVARNLIAQSLALGGWIVCALVGL